VHGLFADVSLRSAMSPGRMRTIDNRHVGEINALVMDFALLASLFAAISSAARSELMAQALLFAMLGAVMLIIPSAAMEPVLQRLRQGRLRLWIRTDAPY
jgi:hypothetical protein